MDLSYPEMNLLESLSNGELMKLADKYGLDISGSHQRVCLIEELLEYGKKNAIAAALDVNHGGNDTVRNGGAGGLAGGHAGGKEEHDKGDGFGAPLPKEYNISFIDVNVRDPLWIFVFWGIKNQEREHHENAPDFKGYCLRAVQLKENGTGSSGLHPADLQSNCPHSDGTVAFSVAVGADDISRYLSFPPGVGSFFQIELCALHGTGGAVLAVSRPFRLPRLINNRNGNGVVSELDSDVHNVYGNPLAQLSGIENYSLTRSVDRLPRSREA